MVEKERFIVFQNGSSYLIANNIHVNQMRLRPLTDKLQILVAVMYLIFFFTKRYRTKSTTININKIKTYREDIINGEKLEFLYQHLSLVFVRMIRMLSTS